MYVVFAQTSASHQSQLFLGGEKRRAEEENEMEDGLRT